MLILAVSMIWVHVPIFHFIWSWPQWEPPPSDTGWSPWAFPHSVWHGCGPCWTLHTSWQFIHLPPTFWPCPKFNLPNKACFSTYLLLHVSPISQTLSHTPSHHLLLQSRSSRPPNSAVVPRTRLPNIIHPRHQPNGSSSASHAEATSPTIPPPPSSHTRERGFL